MIDCALSTIRNTEKSPSVLPFNIESLNLNERNCVCEYERTKLSECALLEPVWH